VVQVGRVGRVGGTWHTGRQRTWATDLKTWATEEPRTPRPGMTPRLKKATESAVACGGRGSMRQACLQALEAAGRAVTMEWQGLGRRLVI